MRLPVGMMSVALGLLGLCSASAQTDGSGHSPWNWFRAAGSTNPTPPKPSAEPPAPVGSGTTSPEHVLRQTTCNIPFTVDHSKHSPLELQLYVSQDRGATWKFYAKAAPSAGHFTFRAANDGEHWFALRSVEKTATPVDLKKLNPGLKVIFDTREPELRFDAALNESGQVSANWKASDLTLVAESLKVEYQTDPQAPWRTVTLPSSSSDADGSRTGQYKWVAEGLTDDVLVRAEISDRAGNKTVVSRRLLARHVAVSQPLDDFRSRTQTAPTYPVAKGGQSWPASNQLPDRAAPRNASPVELPPPKPSAADAPTANRRDTVRNPFISTKQPVSASPGGPTWPAVEGPMLPSAVPFVPPSNEPLAEEEEITPIVGSPAPARPLVGPTQPTSVPTSLPAAPLAPPMTASSSPTNHDLTFALPHGERPRMTNTRQFSLDYEIDALGQATVAKVELWGTDDGGRSWRQWQEDTDRQSPLEVNVPQDGIFGFRIVILGTNQLGGAPPQPGDPADLWVGVDTSLPTVRLTSAIYGEGEHAGQLDIRWQAFDVWFTDRPITLLFSEHPQGPWIPIAAGLANNGQYFWAVDPRIPRRIYLRIEARDEAGNFAEHQIQEPINTAGLVPQGRIRGLRATSSAPPPAVDRSAGRVSAPR